MPFNESALQHLRKEVSRNFGREINSIAECRILSEDLEGRGIILSPQTLRRFFRIIKYSGGYQSYTLDAMSNYCGYENYSVFKNGLIERELVLFFDELGAEKGDDNYWRVSEALCYRLDHSLPMLAEVHYQLLRFPLARMFFIEHHPMRDLSCTVYVQYFQEYLKHKQTPEAKIFAYGFLFMGAFLSDNEEFMDLYHRKILETPLSSDVYVLPAGRKFGVPLLYAWQQQDEVAFSKIYEEMLTARIHYQGASERSVCSFEYSVLEHLIFTDKTEEMKFLIEHNTQQKYSDVKFVPRDRKENHEECWKIMCAVAYCKMKDHEKVQHYLQEINLEKLSVGWKKFYSILFYFVQYEYCAADQKSAIRTKLYPLIMETHFSYFEELLHNLDLHSPAELN